MKCTSNWMRTSEKGHVTLIPCGKCLGCTVTKQQEWILRVLLAKKGFKSSAFVTLTYQADEHGLADLNYSHFKQFMKNLRKHTPEKIQFYCVGEHGPTTNRAHWHAIILGHDFPPQEGDLTLANSLRCLERGYWRYGKIYVGNVTEKSIGYTARYSLNKRNDPRKIQMASHKLGRPYIDALSSSLWKVALAKSMRDKSSQVTISLPWHLKFGKKRYPLARVCRLWMQSNLEDFASKEGKELVLWQENDFVSLAEAQHLAKTDEISLTEAKAHLRWLQDPSYELTGYGEYAVSEAERMMKEQLASGTL